MNSTIHCCMVTLSLLLLIGAPCSSTPELTQDSGNSSVKISESVLVLAGQFQMGTDSEGDDGPLHTVHVDAFYMDRIEVTNAQYLKFCEDTGQKLPEFWGLVKYHSGPDFPNHPVVGVSWYDATKYAEWCGKRLPTEAEWEYAARGGLTGNKYTNGDAIDSTLANYNWKGRTGGGTVPVGSYPPNGFGLNDMTGNVVEWVDDLYSDYYYSASPDSNPQGPEKGKFRVIRGGGWHSGPYCNQVHFRNALPSGWVDINVGFRCVSDSK